MTKTPPNSKTDGGLPESSTSPVVITESMDPMENPKRSKPSSTPGKRRGKRNGFDPLPFLYRTLIGIFIVEAIFLGWSFTACRDIALQQPPKTIQEHCPRIGERAENLFGISIATVLSLIGGAAVEDFRRKKDS